MQASLQERSDGAAAHFDAVAVRSTSHVPTSALWDVVALAVIVRLSNLEHVLSADRLLSEISRLAAWWSYGPGKRQCGHAMSTVLWLAWYVRPATSLIGEAIGSVVVGRTDDSR